MNKNFGFSLAEVMVTMFVIGALAIISLPTFTGNAAEKKYIEGFNKGFMTISKAADMYFTIPFHYVMPTKDHAEKFSKYLIETLSVKELYADANPDKKSEIYASLQFKGGLTAGAKDPVSISPPVEISSTSSFWFVTDDNLPYSVILPAKAKCLEVLNINALKTLDKAVEASCFAVIVDTNGLYNNPNTLETLQDYAKEQYIPSLTNDRYYIFIGSNGAAAGNPKHIISAKYYKGTATR